MTIKKTGNASAAIADRFKLDSPDPKSAKKKGGAGSATSTMTSIAFFAALAGLAIAGILTLVIYQHWEFLKSV